MQINSPQLRRTFSRRVVPFALLALALVIGSASSSIGKLGTAQEPAAPQAGFAPTCSNPHFPTDTPDAMDGTSCGIAGNGEAETSQNDAKNNFCAPDPARAITIADMVDLQMKVQQDQTIPFGNPRQHPLTSQAGPATDRAPLVALGEGSHVVLSGHVRIARQEGPESVNCGTHVPNEPDFHDIHISIVQNPDDAECSGVVVEMTPHHRPDAWNHAKVQAVATAGLLVRVTGHLMFDSSHTPCMNGRSVRGDPARISLWEIHPIYKFEVCPAGDCGANGGWVPLEDWKQTGS